MSAPQFLQTRCLHNKKVTFCLSVLYENDSSRDLVNTSRILLPHFNLSRKGWREACNPTRYTTHFSSPLPSWKKTRMRETFSQRYNQPGCVYALRVHGSTLQGMALLQPRISTLGQWPGSPCSRKSRKLDSRRLACVQSLRD